ncbi:hypothetical protein [Noviherbaspirillum autotrophicum]|uniref:Uncharacterized protein n=1 Tax=Noviherbaspirillum autotrophicum TaxID=709839 RepID=A0A0C1Y7P0_9BURK|nr:hypothetical protein [Noviherbaspirillum autotrophicum]KIF82878.1 hypothetical protein TSA66_21900 [Noviherbaspirillum autotrophicum]
MLQDLKRTGYFLGPQTPSIATGYTEQEVCNFSERLLQRTLLVEDIAPSSPNAMAFTDIMRHLKFGSDRSKAQFVKDYLDGKIKALGRWGDSIDSIFFSLQEAHDFAWRCRLNASRQDYCSLADAARLIGCDAKAVPGLVKVGLLRSKPKQKTYICRKSICEFSESWVALCSIAQSVSTTSKRLEKLADQANIERLVIAPVYQNAEPSSFIRKEDQDRLLAEHKAHPARKRRATLIKLMADGLS